MILVANLLVIIYRLNLNNMNETDKLLKLIRYLIIGLIVFFFIMVILMTCSVVF